MTTTYHAEHVGSLLRPQWLLDARDAREKGVLSTEELRAAEDRAIAEHIALQEDAGITVFTDGEARRESWRAGLMESLDGVVPAKRTMAWYRDGKQLPPQEVPSEGVAANAKVTRKQELTGVEAAFMATHAPGTFKITMISASMGAMIWNPQISAAAYPTPASLIEDLTVLQLEEIDGLATKHGVRWVQLDSLAYNRVFDPDKGDNVRGGLSPGQLLDATVTVDAKIVGTVKATHPDVTVAMHICRGNFRSAYGGQGSYEPVAERLFNEVPVDRFLLEYDTERAGGFEPLRFVPRGPTVVLGLISTKVPELENQDELCRRVEEAARYVPLENLALSPQCGFASGSVGNLITLDDERRKLELVVSTAERIWGLSKHSPAIINLKIKLRRAMKAPHTRRPWPVLASAVLAAGLVACSSGPASTGSTTAAGQPELSTITLGVLSASDDVTVQIAQDEGYFKQEGLNVKVVVLPSTNAATTGLLSHTLDFTTENYVGMFQQENAVPNLNLRIVADNTQASPDLYALMVAKNSNITSLAGLKGRKVSFPAKGFNFGSMAADILMEPYHLSSSSFTTVVLPFPAAPQAVASGAVDAAFTTEPFITIMEESTGAHILEDMLSGPLAGFPVSCWGTTAAFVSKHPNAVAAFQRAMVKAVRLAASSTPLVRQELPKFIKTMNPQIAKVITLPTFNTTLTLARMERVANVMIRLKAIPAGFDVKSMFYPPPAGS
jgi:5-methyltetrahydropteroyltriglutamate--homocysteine methyltransferase